MTFHERIQAVLDGETPERVPFMCYDNLLPRGDLELGLRQRGMGLCLRRPVVWCEYSHVNVDVQAAGDITTITYHTPAGDLTNRRRNHMGSLPDDASCDLDGLVKTPDDLKAAIAMVSDAVFHVDASAYTDTVFEIGADGIVSGEGPQPPYDTTGELAGYRPGMLNAHQTITNWLYLQEASPVQFAALLEALAAQEERRLQAVIASPLRLVSLGRIDGQIGPERWRQQVLPFYQRTVPQLQAAGKLCSLHAHASNLAAYADLIAKTGVDMVEAITPPPRGDLSLGEARRRWGDKVMLWVNVSESLFWHGPDWVKSYVQALAFAGGPQGRLIIGCTELGAVGVVDDETESLYRQGYHAMLDALGYPR
jgi:hypothetical protein